MEITTDRTVFFYLGLFGTIMAVSRGMIPDQTESFDPELLIRGVVEHTHYMPSEWEDKLHTDEVYTFVHAMAFLIHLSHSSHLTLPYPLILGPETICAAFRVQRDVVPYGVYELGLDAFDAVPELGKLQ